MLVIRDLWHPTSIVPLFFQIVDGKDAKLLQEIELKTFFFEASGIPHQVSIYDATQSVLIVQFDCNKYARNLSQYQFSLLMSDNNTSNRVISKGIIELL
jgi:hypothetical protein